MQIINGKLIAEKLQLRLKEKLKAIAIVPKLAVVLVGDNPASQVYVRNKSKKAEYVGIASEIIKLPADATQDELMNIINELNSDTSINGILVQLPLPVHINQYIVINAIDPRKDVDCFHSQNVGNLVIGKHNFIPCTPYGVLHLIKHVLGNDLSGLEALVVGRSNIVGKPLSHLLLQENCTVVIAHSKTRDLDEKSKIADIVIAAVGKPKLIKSVKKGAVVIDVGINSVDGKLIGDVDFDEVSKNAAAITPVPGGVGPMTITFLLINTFLAACQQIGISGVTVNDIMVS